MPTDMLTPVCVPVCLCVITDADSSVGGGICNYLLEYHLIEIQLFNELLLGLHCLK